MNINHNRVVFTIVGVVIGISIMIIAAIPKTTFDVSIITNIFIAIATGIATWIHVDSTTKQRRDRVWDINKGVLFELLEALTQVIKASEYHLEEAQMDESSGQIDHELGPKPEADVYKNFDEKQEYVLSVYRTLMGADLIKNLEEARAIHAKIKERIDEDSIFISEAYQESLDTYKNLQKYIWSFMADISGAKDMK